MPCWASLWTSMNFKDLLNIRRVVYSDRQEPSAANTGAEKSPGKLQCCYTLWYPSLRSLDLKGIIMI